MSRMRSKIQSILNEDSVADNMRKLATSERGSNPANTGDGNSFDAPATADIKGGTFDTKKDTQARVQDNFAKLDVNKRYAEEISELTNRILPIEKSEEIENFIRSTTFKKDSAESYVSGIRQIIAERMNLKNKYLTTLRDAIKTFNDTIEGKKAMWSRGLNTSHLTIPDIENASDFKSVLAFLSSGDPNNHAMELFLPLHGLDLSDLDSSKSAADLVASIDAEKVAEYKGETPNKTSALQRKYKNLVNHLDPNFKVDRRLTGKEIVKSAKEIIAALDGTLTEVKDPRRALNTAVRRDGKEGNIEETLQSYFTWLIGNEKVKPTAEKLQKLIGVMVDTAKAVEINDAIIAGLLSKLKKIKNFGPKFGKPRATGPSNTAMAAQGATAEMPPLTDELFVLDPKDFPADPNVAAATIEDAKDALSSASADSEIEKAKARIAAFAEMLDDPEITPEEAEEIKAQIAQIADAAGIDVPMKEAAPVIMESKEEYKPRRRLNEKEKLQDAWRRSSKNILGKEVAKDQKDPNSVDVHLGGL